MFTTTNHCLIEGDHLNIRQYLQYQITEFFYVSNRSFPLTIMDVTYHLIRDKSLATARKGDKFRTIPKRNKSNLHHLYPSPVRNDLEHSKTSNKNQLSCSLYITCHIFMTHTHEPWQWPLYKAINFTPSLNF